MIAKSKKKSEVIVESVNKAELIRAALKKLGMNASAKDIQDECKPHDVAPAQISNIRTKLRGGGPVASSKVAGDATANELLEARKMAEKCGGVERARQLLDVLAQLRA